AEMEKRKMKPNIKTPDEVNDNLERGRVLAGKKLYNLYCGSCHQGDGKGDGNRFPPLVGSETVLGNNRKLIEVILNGLEGPIKVLGVPYNGIMPPHAFLTDDEISQVLTYIRVQFNNSTAIPAKQVARIRELSNPKPQ